ncbi:DUF4198 domain-containing protein [Blastopirellula marina]|nr:DUF4198 domain-containing protein [Blastopirellula marina]
MIRHNQWIGVVAIGLAAMLAGCGKSLPATSPVEGYVTFDGKPLEDATVIFVSGNANMSNGEVALGKTDPQGKFILTTFVGGEADVKGAMPGSYQVTISKMVPPSGMALDKYLAMVEAYNKKVEQGEMVSAEQAPPPMVESLPGKYSAAGTTKLTAEVKQGEANEIKFDLDK